MTKKNIHNERQIERAGREERRPPSLVPAPQGLAMFIRLANLVPKVLRRSSTKSSTDDEARLLSDWHRVRDVWGPSDEDAYHNMFNLQRFVAELPLPLQVFILKDDEGRFIEFPYGSSYETAPRFDVHHLQPLDNITLIESSERRLHAEVSKAKERINIEAEKTQPEPPLPSNKPQRRSTALLIDELVFGAYHVGNIKFRKVGLSYLANRARQRLFFILAAEEILDALVGPDTERKLDHTWHMNESNAVRGYLFVENDEVKSHPPILFSFVVGVQASRIRRCGICENYFWAGRKDKQVCSPQCSATSRKRQQRVRDFEKKLGIRRRAGKTRK